MKKINLSNQIQVSIEGFESFNANAPFSDIGTMVKLNLIENPLVCKNPDAVVDSVEKKHL